MRTSSFHVIKIVIPVICFAMITFSIGCADNDIGEVIVEDAATLPNAININTASKEELAKLPYVGEKIAERIIEHRATHGPFERPEHLMLIQGISDKRFRKIRPMVRTE